jgi:predicted anti-sigma-YlaC factor YlaD
VISRPNAMDSHGHERYASLMSVCLDGAATREEWLELAGHLDSCSACAAIWERWQEVDRLLSTTPSVAPSRSLAEGVSERLSQSSSRESQWGWLTVGVALVGTMSLGTSCLAFASLLWWGWRHPLELVAVLSAGAKLVSGMSWVLAGIESMVESIGGPGLTALLAWCLIGAGGLAVFWISDVARARGSNSSTPFDPT